MGNILSALLGKDYETRDRTEEEAPPAPVRVDAPVASPSPPKPSKRPKKLSPTRLDVLKLIADDRPLGDYVPRYRKGAHRGFGAFPVTIAERAASYLLREGLVRRKTTGANLELTDAGRRVLDASTHRGGSS